MGTRLSFKDRYDQSLVFKLRDVEEPIDMVWHRPLAALLAAALIPLPITPNQVTFMSLIVGWCATAAFYATVFVEDSAFGPWGFVLSGLLMFFSVIFDCADGQLARAKGGGTRMGRILDGLVDVLVMAPLYVLVVFHIGDVHGTFAFWFSAFAGLFAWGQILAYDAIKSTYLANAMEYPPKGDGAESMEEVQAEYDEIKASGKWVDIILFSIYVHGLIRFSRFFANKKDIEIKERNTPGEIETFVGKHRTTMRIVSNIGLGSHVLFFYGSIIALALSDWATYAAQWLFVFVFGALFVVGISRSRSMEPVYEGADSDE